eukprot:6491015-Amphidinium_carterae.3
MHDGGWWQAAIKRSLSDMHSASLWDHLLPTERTASMVFKTCTRAQALTYDLLVLRNRAYPQKLVALVEGDFYSIHCAIAELLTAPPCCLDPFTAKLRSAYPQADDLAGGECQTLLRATLRHVSGTTYDTERLHSRNARRQLSRRMTHRPRACDLAIQHAGRGFPACVAGVFEIRGKHSQKGHKVHEPIVEQVEDQTQKRRGSGGAWRAFLHCEAQRLQKDQPIGPRAPFDFLGLAAKYKTLTDAEKDKYRRLGKQGTKNAQNNGKAFNPTFFQAAANMFALPNPQPQHSVTLVEAAPHQLSLRLSLSH